MTDWGQNHFFYLHKLIINPMKFTSISVILLICFNLIGCQTPGKVANNKDQHEEIISRLEEARTELEKAREQLEQVKRELDFLRIQPLINMDLPDTIYIYDSREEKRKLKEKEKLNKGSAGVELEFFQR
jgi:hypothetical protein